MSSALFSRTDNSKLSEWWWTIDHRLLFCIITLLILGAGLVTSASPPVAERIDLPTYHFLKKHLLFLGVGFTCLLFISFLSEKAVWRFSALGFLGAILLMILTQFIGFETKGAQRWIYILGFNVQPSEFLKPTFLIVSAWLLTLAKSAYPKQQKRLIIANFTLLGLCIALLLAQPDLGMVILLGFSFCVQLFLYGFSLRYFVGLIALASLGLLLAYFSFDHVQSRMDRFLDPTSGDSYQIDRSLEAFANGGLLGAGPGQGTVKRQLPDGHADFIFSVAGEEFGFLPTLLLITAFAFLFARGVQQLMRQNSLFSMIAGGSLLAMLAAQTMIHMGSAMQLIPTKGMTLPLISYGGSSMISVCCSLGVIMALTKRGNNEQNFRLKTP